MPVTSRAVARTLRAAPVALLAVALVACANLVPEPREAASGHVGTPQPPAAEAQPIEMLQFEIDNAMADQGAYEYGVRCTVCHGFNAISAGMAPDLRASPILASEEAFAEVVRNGSLQVNGMPVFEHLSDDQLSAIRHYVRREAEKAIGE